MKQYVTEAQTRQEIIDKSLEKAGWNAGDPSQFCIFEPHSKRRKASSKLYSRF